MIKNIPINNLVDEIHEECGVIGICTNKQIDIASMLYYSLFALQHRGEQSCGMMVTNGSQYHLHKDLGYIGSVFPASVLRQLNSIENANVGIAHVRYGSEATRIKANAQPYVLKLKDESIISIVHNGNLINVDAIKKLLPDVKFEGNCDTEPVLHLLKKELDLKNDIIIALTKICKFIEGSFSFIITYQNKVYAIRDPYAIRPLCIGKLNNGEGYIAVSESCALDVISAQFVKDVKKGEIVCLDGKNITSFIYDDTKQKKSCIFEHVYFARPDSIIDGQSVHMARFKQGEILYREHPLKADVVFGTPDSGTCAALGYAYASKIPYTIGFVKSKYITRTFIQPTQELRTKDVSIKLNPLKQNIEGKNVILIDDSIVRGTTSFHLIKTLRRAGAKKIYLLSASPMVKWPCFLGVDMHTRKELLAANSTLKQMNDLIKADYLGFLSIEGLIECCGNKDEFCTGCFIGKYPIKPPYDINK